MRHGLPDRVRVRAVPVRERRAVPTPWLLTGADIPGWSGGRGIRTHEDGVTALAVFKTGRRTRLTSGDAIPDLNDDTYTTRARRRAPTWSVRHAGRYADGHGATRRAGHLRDRATPEQLAEARENFRRKLAEARERMTPEKWAELRRLFGRDDAA